VQAGAGALGKRSKHGYQSSSCHWASTFRQGPAAVQGLHADQQKPQQVPPQLLWFT
jgi:hypothetical protein